MSQVVESSWVLVAVPDRFRPVDHQSGGRVVLTQSVDAQSALPLIEAERVTATALVSAIAIRWSVPVDDDVQHPPSARDDPS